MLKKNNYSQLKSRMNVINIIYIHELKHEEINKTIIKEKYVISSLELQALYWILNKYKNIKNLITFFLKKGWEWNRIAPLERSILIYGVFELAFRDKKIVINELILLAKSYIAEDSYKFINAILDKVSKYYENKK